MMDQLRDLSLANTVGGGGEVACLLFLGPADGNREQLCLLAFSGFDPPPSVFATNSRADFSNLSLSSGSVGSGL